jgi:hypothetical protein
MMSHVNMPAAPRSQVPDPTPCIPQSSTVFADPATARVSGGWTFAVTNDATIKIAYGATVGGTG